MKIWGRREQRKVGMCPHLEDPPCASAPWLGQGWEQGLGRAEVPWFSCPHHSPTHLRERHPRGGHQVCVGGRRGQEAREFCSWELRGPPCGEVRAWFSDKHQKRPFIPLNFPRSLPSSWLVIHAPI